VGLHGTIHPACIMAMHRHPHTAPEPVGPARGAVAATSRCCCCCWPRAVPTACRRVRVGVASFGAGDHRGWRRPHLMPRFPGVDVELRVRWVVQGKGIPNCTAAARSGGCCRRRMSWWG
jgi:hypothetical protein